MSHTEEIDYLVKLAEEQGVEIKVSRFSDQDLFFTGAIATAIFNYIFGNLSWIKFWLLSIAGGFAFRRIYVLIPFCKCPLSEFLSDKLTLNEKRQLCSRIRMVWKNFAVFLKNGNINLEPIMEGEGERVQGSEGTCTWNIEYQKQRVIEKILEYLKQKYNLLEVDM